jgi:hypothetical protein
MSKQSASYTPVSVTDTAQGDNYELTVALVEDPSLYLDHPAKTVNDQYSNLPEAQHLTWEDNFFDEEPDVVAVFDFDYEAMENFNTSVGWASLGCTIIYTPLFVLSMIGLAPCYLRRNTRWNAQAQHVAITRDGIRFVRDKRQCCWGMQCTDQGKSSKTVPFDMITDCDIAEPAGNTCICVPNILTKVNIDTASSGAEGKKELKLVGLKDAHSFKRLVWAMKRSQQGAMMSSTSQPPSAFAMAGRHPQQDGDENVASLLREIRDELRQNNDLLQKLKPEETTSAVLQQQPVVTSAPVVSAPTQEDMLS